MAFCRVLVGPISTELGLSWPPEIIQLSDQDAAVLEQFKFVQILEEEPLPPGEPLPEPLLNQEFVEPLLTVDLNTASLEELQTLPSVGPATAQKFVDGRPYDSLEAARTAGGLTDAKWAEIEALVSI